MTVTMKAPLEVGVAVTDLERATAFYQSAMGFERISEATLTPERATAAGFGPVHFRMVRMQTNYGERIKLIETEPRARKDSAEQPILAQAGISYLTFVVADIEAAMARLAKSGVTFSSAGPVQTRPGTRLVFFRDSEGNPLELVQYDDLAAYRPDI
jgi:catechol 2,3-dioxygenase-like lactoylglutathione lyase family enzyme